jgi:hypothetical protein
MSYDSVIGTLSLIVSVISLPVLNIFGQKNEGINIFIDNYANKKILKEKILPKIMLGLPKIKIIRLVIHTHR